jgi:hypothetical protein
MPKTETLTTERRVDGNDLALMLRDILRDYVAKMPPVMQVQVDHRRRIVRDILNTAKAHDNAAPLLAMLLESLSDLADEAQAQGVPDVTH